MFLVEDDVILIKLHVKYTTISVSKQEKLMASLVVSQKSANRAFLVNPGETPKERTPRSSMSSRKDERSKPKQKEWGAEQPSQLCLFLYLMSSVRLQNHSETKLVYRDLLSACDRLVTDIPHFRNYKRNGYKLSAQRFLESFGWPIVSYDWLVVV